MVSRGNKDYLGKCAQNKTEFSPVSGTNASLMCALPSANLFSGSVFFEMGRVGLGTTFFFYLEQPETQSLLPLPLVLNCNLIFKL